MRIDNNALNLTQALGQTAQVQGSQNSAHGNYAKGGDSVSLSSFAQVASGDSPRVQQLAADYSAGRYNVSPQQIAGSMIGEWLQA